MRNYTEDRHAADIAGLVAMYPPKSRLFRLWQDDLIPNQPVLWCSMEDFGDFCNFCQYMLDGALSDKMAGFTVNWMIGNDRGNWGFYDFCNRLGIRKRTREERMSDVQIFTPDEAALYRDAAERL